MMSRWGLERDRGSVKMWRRLKAELSRVGSDTNILLVLAVAPVVYMLIFGLTYENAKVTKIPVVVVDQDKSVFSRALIRELETSEALHVSALLDDESGLRPKFMEEECWGAVVIPRDCERDLKRGLPVPIASMANTSNIIIGNYVQRGMQAVLAAASGDIGADRMVRHGTSVYAAKNLTAPIGLQSRTLFNPASNYANFVVPLLFMLLVHQVVALGAGMSSAKTLSGELGPVPEGVSSLKHIVFRGAPFVLAGLFWTAFCAVGGHAWLAIPFHGGVLPLMLLSLLLSVNAALFGSIAGAIVRDKVGVVQLLFFFSMPALLISGGSWPLASMPRPLQALAILLPSTHIMTAYRQLALEGAGFGELLPALGALVVLAVGLCVVLRALLRRAEVGRESFIIDELPRMD